ncbi:hypothetical protein [Streptomyces sp. NPDC020965]
MDFEIRKNRHDQRFLACALKVLLAHRLPLPGVQGIHEGVHGSGAVARSR